MWSEIVDQSAHFIGGAVIAALLGLCSNAPSWALVFGALVFGTAREVVQHRRLPRGRGSFTDIAFWALGGLTFASIA